MLGGDEFAEVRRRIADRLRAFLGEALADRRVLERGNRRLVQLVDDLRRRAGRRDEAVPCGGFVIRPAVLGDGRHVRHGRHALLAGDRERAHLLGLDHAGDRRDRGDHELRLAAQHVGDRGAGAAIGHMHGVGLGDVIEQQRRQMARRAVAGRAVGELARMRLSVVHELLEGLEFRFLRHDDDQRRGGDQRDRCEGGQRVDLEALEHVRVHRHRSLIGHQDRIAVRRGLGRGLGGDIAARRRDVFNDDGLAELFAGGLRHQPRDRIGAAARRIRHDQLDRAARIILSQQRRGRGDRGCGENAGAEQTARDHESDSWVL